MGARFEALVEGVPVAPFDSRYTQVGFYLISVQVCQGALSIFHPAQRELQNSISFLVYEPISFGDTLLLFYA